MSTSLTSCACRPARETAALIAALPSCGAVSGAKAPWKPAMAVRAMPTMTIGSSADAAMAQSPAVWLLDFPAPWSTGPYTWSTWARRPTGAVKPQPCQTQKGPDLAERLACKAGMAQGADQGCGRFGRDLARFISKENLQIDAGDPRTVGALGCRL